MNDRTSDILGKFLVGVEVNVFQVLKKNQEKIAWRKELAETKKYVELDGKMTALCAGIKVLKEDLNAKDKVLEVIRDIKAHQLAHYVDLEDEVIKSDFEMLKDALVPYSKLIAPMEETRLVQSSLVSQARLKKLPLPYEELQGALKQVATQIAFLSEKIDGITSYAMQSLEKVA